ncbi:hypothetical protein QZH41_000345 [Actinostola sp. cb2023]|nr:hypothetical protein QZH41_000345 [Actinostola sp. cb2023]
MEECLGELRDNMTIPYLDDVIVFSRSFQEHLQHLRIVLCRLKEHGVKLKPHACNHGLRAVLYQKQDDKNRVIAYASRTLTPAEKNYCVFHGFMKTTLR